MTAEGPLSPEPEAAEVLPNKHQLLEAPSAATDPDALVEGLLGGQVIEEFLDDD
jgi:hypothetical protein